MGALAAIWMSPERPIRVCPASGIAVFRRFCDAIIMQCYAEGARDVANQAPGGYDA
ncbi:hypothetical protein [Nitrolancea hollandica]|uniref:hypothetical protein n=1 Tax=Nitrolancea hollandica TaxID=1206749 RepID=UPI00031475B5|nr:hypothetical protein [Nitrolancea hollandica]